MSPRVLNRLGIVVIVALAGASLLTSVPPAGAVVLTFPPANQYFRTTWERTDKPVAEGLTSRTWMWGLNAFTAGFKESYADSPGGLREVQYYDKSRMEISDPAGDPNSIWYVTNGLLVVELVSGRMQTGNNAFADRGPAEVNVAGDADDPLGPTYATIGGLRIRPALPNGSLITQRVSRAGVVSEDPGLASEGVTSAYRVQVPGIDHQVASPFWSFMNSGGMVYEDGGYTTAPLFINPFYATGYPIAEAYWASVKVAGTYKDVLMQCFERRCLTYTPGNAAGWQVEAGNVGQHYYHWRYEQPLPEQTLWVRSAAGPLSATSGGWEPMQTMNVTINAPATGDVAITLSAQAFVDMGARVFLRAMLDGQTTTPADVMFAYSNVPWSESFTFLAKDVPAGPHYVEVQWLVDAGSTATAYGPTLTVSVNPSNPWLGRLIGKVAPSGPMVTNTSGIYAPVPDLTLSAYVPGGGDLAITFSAEAYTGGGRMFVQALIDGSYDAEPGGVVFASGGYVATHSYTFVVHGLTSGWHDVQLQWAQDGGGTGYLGDRSVAVTSAPGDATAGGLVATAPFSAAFQVNSTNWGTLPSQQLQLWAPAGSDLAVTVGVQAVALSGRLEARALVDGQPAAPAGIVLHAGDVQGTWSYTFAVENLPAGTHAIEINWRQSAMGATANVTTWSIDVRGWPGK